MRRAQELELALGRRPPQTTRQRWLYEEIRNAILSGRLARAARLPASRDLARQYDLARGTVLAVYDQLSAEGYVAGHIGRGTFVAPSLPEVRMQPASPPPGASIPSKLSQRGVLLARTIFPVDGHAQPQRAFRPSQPDLRAFPVELWRRLSGRRARLANAALLASGPAMGYRPLQEAIAEHLRGSRGISCSANHVAIIGSVQQALDLCARLLLDPGDRVWLEEPGYTGARLVFEAAGAKVVPVPVDDDGLQVEVAIRRAPSAKLAYVTAGRQAPLGVTLSLDRRLALLAWASRSGATIIEDDYDSEFRFTGHPLAAMKSLDTGGHVVYAGTFSKFLFPALRLAYLVLPERLVEPFAAAHSLTARHAPILSQAILADFIGEGHFGRHIRRMRMLYAERAMALQAALGRHMSGPLDVPPITAGLDTPAFFTAPRDDRAIAKAALAIGIETRPLSDFWLQARGRAGLQLGFACVGVREIQAGVAQLGRLIASTGALRGR
jgi:GntR family transcriptional regulator/MocR family aminotransferase